MKHGNIRNPVVREQLTREGWTWVAVLSHGENKGEVFTRHRSYAAANRSARGLNLTLVEVREGASF
jgi:hypothetical protein